MDIQHRDAEVLAQQRRQIGRFTRLILQHQHVLKHRNVEEGLETVVLAQVVVSGCQGEAQVMQSRRLKGNRHFQCLLARLDFKVSRVPLKALVRDHQGYFLGGQIVVLHRHLQRDCLADKNLVLRHLHAENLNFFVRGSGHVYRIHTDTAGGQRLDRRQRTPVGLHAVRQQQDTRRRGLGYLRRRKFQCRRNIGGTGIRLVRLQILAVDLPRIRRQRSGVDGAVAKGYDTDLAGFIAGIQHGLNEFIPGFLDLGTAVRHVNQQDELVFPVGHLIAEGHACQQQHAQDQCDAVQCQRYDAVAAPAELFRHAEVRNQRQCRQRHEQKQEPRIGKCNTEIRHGYRFRQNFLWRAAAIQPPATPMPPPRTIPAGRGRRQPASSRHTCAATHPPAW